jgi:leucyl-tRNA synthetase
LGEDGEKMSKSRGNVVNPDEIVKEMGADTLRMYEMFMGPFEQAKPWSTKSTGGIRKFLEKVWRIFHEKELTQDFPEKEGQKLMAQTIKKVGEDIDDFKFNTAISQLMILFNGVQNWESLPKSAAEKICILLSPFAPHLAEELWSKILGHKESICNAPWPTYDPKFLEEDTVIYAVQINGKIRGDFEIAKDASKEEAIAHAKKIEKVAKYLGEGEIQKEIFVPGKIVGFVVK